LIAASQPVQAQRIRGQNRQGIAAQQPKRTVVGQWIGGQLTQLLRQDLVVLPRQGARDLLGRQKRAQVQQRLDRRRFPTNSLQGQRPHGRHPPLRPGKLSRMGQAEQLHRPVTNQSAS
jgi:hypothetical protein